jgi:mRNA-degrading endonuclease RelE of RelBE toxin-antitoxin system
MYSIKLEKSVLKVLEKLNELNYSRIKKSILNLTKNPRPKGFKKTSW